jgi:ABC-type nitrate/sulfonate/bicarbonate transport system substrate-binding protein
MIHNRLQRLRLGTFTPSVILDVARTTGRLADAGLDVVEVSVASSPSQFASLAAGELDAVFTSPDNAIAYRFLVDNPLRRLLDVEIVLALDRGLGLQLALRPGLAAVEPGSRFGVDVPVSGFAFVGYALLECAGLLRDDYEVLTLGATPRRADALIVGKCDITVLNAGNELRAESHGATLGASATDLGPYLGTVLARLRGSPGAVAADRLAEVLRDTAEGVITGGLVSAAFQSARDLLSLTDDLADQHVAVLRSPSTGAVADGVVDIASIETLIALRRQFLPDPALDTIVPELLVRSGRLGDAPTT